MVGIDNDLSKGATELLIPFFNSKVRMHQMNLYDLKPESFGLLTWSFFRVFYTISGIHFGA